MRVEGSGPQSNMLLPQRPALAWPCCLHVARADGGLGLPVRAGAQSARSLPQVQDSGALQVRIGSFCPNLSAVGSPTAYAGQANRGGACMLLLLPTLSHAQAIPIFPDRLCLQAVASFFRGEEPPTPAKQCYAITVCFLFLCPPATTPGTPKSIPPTLLKPLRTGAGSAAAASQRAAPTRTRPSTCRHGRLS